MITVIALASIGVSIRYHQRIKILEEELQSQSRIKTNESLTAEASRIKANQSPTTESSEEEARKSFTMTEIGRIHSPFPQRAGCPRQGGKLAPHIRSRLIFHPCIPMETLDGITSYSHVWVVFAFHLNPRGKASSGRQGQVKFTATKIRPPRANGIKVGVLATRAPHRPNPVGLSLGLVEKVELISFQGCRRVCLVLRGLDLVDDTPVYDLKPYVPWDRVDSLESSPINASLSIRMEHLATPKWVSEDDELPRVEWAEAATSALLKHADELRPLFDDVAADAKSAISEIVAQDPRALHDGRGKRSDDDFHFSFGSLRVSFRVQDCAVHVTQVVLDEGDLKATPGSYPHNLALRRRAEACAREQGRHLEWCSSVKEGITHDLFDLKGGGRYIP
jgi:tRNA-Thr(GGU) m(6)t(6)A37 methyltransferase TsaA